MVGTKRKLFTCEAFDILLKIMIVLCASYSVAVAGDESSTSSPYSDPPSPDTHCIFRVYDSEQAAQLAAAYYNELVATDEGRAAAAPLDSKLYEQLYDNLNQESYQTGGNTAAANPSNYEDCFFVDDSDVDMKPLFIVTDSDTMKKIATSTNVTLLRDFSVMSDVFHQYSSLSDFCSSPNRSKIMGYDPAQDDNPFSLVNLLCFGHATVSSMFSSVGKYATNTPGVDPRMAQQQQQSTGDSNTTTTNHVMMARHKNGKLRSESYNDTTVTNGTTADNTTTTTVDFDYDDEKYKFDIDDAPIVKGLHEFSRGLKEFTFDKPDMTSKDGPLDDIDLSIPKEKPNTRFRLYDDSRALAEQRALNVLTSLFAGVYNHTVSSLADRHGQDNNTRNIPRAFKFMTDPRAYIYAYYEFAREVEDHLLVVGESARAIAKLTSEITANERVSRIWKHVKALASHYYETNEIGKRIAFAYETFKSRFGSSPSSGNNEAILYSNFYSSMEYLSVEKRRSDIVKEARQRQSTFTFNFENVHGERRADMEKKMLESDYGKVYLGVLGEEAGSYLYHVGFTHEGGNDGDRNPSQRRRLKIDGGNGKHKSGFFSWAIFASAGYEGPALWENNLINPLSPSDWAVFIAQVCRLLFVDRFTGVGPDPESCRPWFPYLPSAMYNCRAPEFLPFPSSSAFWGAGFDPNDPRCDQYDGPGTYMLYAWYYTTGGTFKAVLSTHPQYAIILYPIMYDPPNGTLPDNVGPCLAVGFVAVGALIWMMILSTCSVSMCCMCVRLCCIDRAIRLQDDKISTVDKKSDDRFGVHNAHMRDLDLATNTLFESSNIIGDNVTELKDYVASLDRQLALIRAKIPEMSNENEPST